MRKNRILSVAIFTALFTLLGVINSFSATGDTYNSANDYSATSQGVNGWYYEYAQRGTDNYEQMQYHWNNVNWTATNPTNFAILGATFTHPADEVNVCRTWVVPENGAVRISGTAKRDNADWSNGVRLIVKKNLDNLHDEVYGEDLSAPYSLTPTLEYTAYAYVSQGDKIRIVGDSRGNSASDGSTWNIQITYIDYSEMPYPPDQIALPKVTPMQRPSVNQTSISLLDSTISNGVVRLTAKALNTDGGIVGLIIKNDGEILKFDETMTDKEGVINFSFPLFFSQDIMQITFEMDMEGLTEAFSFSRTFYGNNYKTAALAQLNEAVKSETEERLIEFCELFALEFDGTLYRNLDSSLRKFVAERIYFWKSEKEYKEENELLGDFAESYLFFKLNSTDYVTMVNIILEYAEELGVKSDSQYNTFKNMSNDNKLKVTAEIVKSIKNSPLMQKGAFITVFNEKTDYVNNIKPVSNNNGGGGAPSGGYRVNDTVPIEINYDTSVDTKFNDMQGVLWADEAVNYLAKNAVLKGKGEGSFMPNESVTREEFIVILMRALKLHQSDNNTSFLDVEKGEWYYGYISSAQKLGIVSGVSESEFGIGRSITRQEMARMVYNMMEKGLIDLKYTSTSTRFDDENEIELWASQAVNALSGLGIINGMGNGYFEPKSSATRAQAAVIVYNILKKSGQVNV